MAAHSRPLPSPPDLKISDYEDTNKYSKLIHNTNNNNNNDNNNDTSIPLTPPPTIYNHHHNNTSIPPKRPRLLHRQETTNSSLLLSKEFHAVDIVHDPNYCMFKIQLDAKGTTGIYNIL
jgi:hypothetical protein